uniref:Uncharacterized protein n=1 Tax=Timema douglasi TaxID=61478 RepID=A0A7R8ZD09_TIMDO|nr:unnamed protein product [Timema douglasi]
MSSRLVLPSHQTGTRYESSGLRQSDDVIGIIHCHIEVVRRYDSSGLRQSDDVIAKTHCQIERGERVAIFMVSRPLSIPVSTCLVGPPNWHQTSSPERKISPVDWRPWPVLSDVPRCDLMCPPQGPASHITSVAVTDEFSPISLGTALAAGFVTILQHCASQLCGDRKGEEGSLMGGLTSVRSTTVVARSKVSQNRLECRRQGVRVCIPSWCSELVFHSYSTENRKVTVIMDENELNGKRRFVADGFSQERECQVMLELSKIAAIEGDGYNGNISPHTSSERFEGVTLGRAALGWDELSHWARGYWREWEAACLHPPRSLA